MSRLAGRGVVLTGATGGIGAALCHALCASGATVYAVGRDPRRLAGLAAHSASGRVVPIVVDLSADDAPQRMLASLANAAPAPSMLVLGAAVSSFGLFAEQDDATLRAQIDTNLLGPMRLVRALLPQLLGSADPCVVGIGSTFGSLGFPGFAAYSASKFGLRGFIEALAREHADGPLRVQYLSPRATRTPINSPAVDAMNAELGTAMDQPQAVAAQLLAAIERGDRRRQLGWPERLFARLNGALPALVDRALAAQLPIIRRHARGAHRASTVDYPAPALPTITSETTP
jgi:short-subunit dehydrogenase